MEALLGIYLDCELYEGRAQAGSAIRIFLELGSGQDILNVFKSLIPKLWYLLSPISNE